MTRGQPQGRPWHACMTIDFMAQECKRFLNHGFPVGNQRWERLAPACWWHLLQPPHRASRHQFSSSCSYQLSTYLSAETWSRVTKARGLFKKWNENRTWGYQVPTNATLMNSESARRKKLTCFFGISKLNFFVQPYPRPMHDGSRPAIIHPAGYHMVSVDCPSKHLWNPAVPRRAHDNRSEQGPAPQSGEVERGWLE